MELSDPDASRAVLIGVHSYTRQSNLPAVERNLTDLHRALTDPGIWGLPAGHCRVLAQPGDAEEVLGALLEEGRQAQDTFVVYYAGHGLTDPHTDELFLTLPRSNPEFTETALAYRSIRRVLRDSRIRARRKVVILDCCYSGRALEGAMGAAVANRTVTDGTHVLTAAGPTEVAWSPPGEPHTAFTGELVRVLEEGIPGGPDLLTTDAVYWHIRTELDAKERPLPHQQNRNAGGDIVLARNRAGSGPGPARPPVPRRPLRAWAARFRGQGKVVLAGALTLAVVAVTTTLVVRMRKPADLPAGVVPAVLRDCQGDGSKATVLSCRDGSGHPATLQIYPDRRTLDLAYARKTGDADVARSTGDCGTAEDAEHRHPITGPEKGRVLCFTGGRTTTVTWTDDTTHTIARIEAPAGDVRTLRDSWASSVAAAPPFPAAEEEALIDMPVATQCRRAGVEEIDDFPGAVGAVTCTGTGGVGAQSVTYFRFDSTPKLQKAMNDHIPADKDPTGVGCEDGKAPKFTGGRGYDLRSVPLGVLSCRPGPAGDLVLEWSVEPLNVAGRAIGVDADDLSRWWRIYHGPPITKIVEAVNELGEKFPNAAEKDLLQRIPPRSRHLCTRPAGEYVGDHVGSSPVVASAVCGPRTGPKIVFYYQFASGKDMRDNYTFLPTESSGPCTASPTTVTGESRYSRGGATGRLRCEDRDGSFTRIWTDERRSIEAFAFQGSDARAMSDWWEHDAGPL